jgi:hypothetical protein
MVTLSEEFLSIYLQYCSLGPAHDNPAFVEGLNYLLRRSFVFLEEAGQMGTFGMECQPMFSSIYDGTTYNSTTKTAIKINSGANRSRRLANYTWSMVHFTGCGWYRRINNC